MAAKKDKMIPSEKERKRALKYATPVGTGRMWVTMGIAFIMLLQEAAAINQSPNAPLTASTFGNWIDFEADWQNCLSIHNGILQSHQIFKKTDSCTRQFYLQRAGLRE